MYMRFGTWNVKSLYGAGSLKTVASELAKYNLDLMAVQDIRWVRVVVSQQMITHFSAEMAKLIVS
jgi:exonuclease III